MHDITIIVIAYIILVECKDSMSTLHRPLVIYRLRPAITQMGK